MLVREGEEKAPARKNASLASYLLCNVNPSGPSFLIFKVTQLYFLRKVIQGFRSPLWQVSGITPWPQEVLLLLITVTVIIIITITIISSQRDEWVGRYALNSSPLVAQNSNYSSHGMLGWVGGELLSQASYFGGKVGNFPELQVLADVP